MSPEQRLKELDITLPPASSPAGNYAAAVRAGDLLYVSGKAPLAIAGVRPRGRLGREYSAEEGSALARSAALDLLATVRATLGTLDQVLRVIELQGALNTTPEFEEHARVLDGASDLLVALFGEPGRHARSVFGAVSLRGQVPLTLRATFQCRPQ
jgi:enamine deaminase RidA (YjgF/YER057c/UK114 family)